jgi:hypothetical protein
MKLVELCYQTYSTPEDYIPNVETGINFYLDGDSRYKICFNLCFSEGIPFDLELQILTLKQHQMGKIFGQAVFLGTKVYGTFQVLEKDSRTRERKTSKYNTVYKFRYNGNGILKHITMKFGLISWVYTLKLLQ